MDKPGQPEIETKSETRKKQHPFRKAVLRGSAVVMPPLLTVVLFLWAWQTIESYILVPIESTTRYLMVLAIADIREGPPSPDDVEVENRNEKNQLEGFSTKSGKVYVRFKSKFIPKEVYDLVEEDPGQFAPTTAKAYYERYVQLKYLPRYRVIPVFLIGFVLFLYYSGKFLAAGMGRILVGFFEGVINRLPLIRNVYSSVKQVTDFAFSESEIEYTRIVAVQYPRKGIWSMGFVTGESMLDIRNAANEPVLSVLMPTSPMPATGFTVTVPKSDTIDLNISIDQAIQFCVSCGVVVPNQQQYKMTVEGNAQPKSLTDLMQKAVSAKNGETKALPDTASTDEPDSDLERADSGSANTSVPKADGPEDGSSNPGSSNPGASNPGSSNPGASNSGASNSGASNSGASNSGASNKSGLTAGSSGDSDADSSPSDAQTSSEPKPFPDAGPSDPKA